MVYVNMTQAREAQVGYVLGSLGHAASISLLYFLIKLKIATSLRMNWGTCNYCEMKNLNLA